MYIVLYCMVNEGANINQSIHPTRGESCTRIYIFTSIAFFGQVICILYHVQYSVDYLARVCDLSPWCYLCSCVAACALTNWTKYEDKNITIEKKKQLKKSDNGLKAKEGANYSKRTRSTQMIIKRWFKCFQNSNSCSYIKIIVLLKWGTYLKRKKGKKCRENGCTFTW